MRRHDQTSIHNGRLKSFINSLHTELSINIGRLTILGKPMYPSVSWMVDQTKLSKFPERIGLSRLQMGYFLI